jgi:hypothetical protein
MPTAKVAPISSTLKTLQFYRELEHLPLQSVTSRMTLQKSKICYYQLGQVKWLEKRNDRYGTARCELINSSSLCLTNKRILFEGNKKTATFLMIALKIYMLRPVAYSSRKIKERTPSWNSAGIKPSWKSC